MFYKRPASFCEVRKSMSIHDDFETHYAQTNYSFHLPGSFGNNCNFGGYTKLVE